MLGASRVHALAVLLLVAQFPSCLFVRPLQRVTKQALQEVGDEMLGAGGGRDDRPPRLFFLFMADGLMTNLPMWTKFFSPAQKGVDYEAYLHCQDRQQCEMAHSDLHQHFHMVDTVDSHWCTNLVDPMNALLFAALESDAGHTNDKFIFISDTTVPIKPFSFVHHKLTVRDAHKSNFCIQEWPKWALFQVDDIMPKHSQWMVLSRAHAHKAMLQASVLKPETMMKQMVPLIWAANEWVAPAAWQFRKAVDDIANSTVLDKLLSLAVPVVRGCADEFWHLAAAVGPINRAQIVTQDVLLDGFGGDRLSMKEEHAEELQGHCDTFAIIDSDKRELAQGLEGNGTRMGGTWGFLRPHIHAGKFLQLSTASLKALGSSEYLFARKMDNTTEFEGNSTLLEAFDSYIFSRQQ